MVTLDYPEEGQQTKAEIKRNGELLKLYNIQAYPTLLLLDADARPYAEAEVIMETADHVAQLEELAKKRKVRDEHFETARKSAGVEKAEALKEGVEGMGLKDGYVSTFYKEEIAALIESDPEDATGFAKVLEVRVAQAKLMIKLDELYDPGNSGPFVAAIDEFIRTNQPEGIIKQEILSEKYYLLEDEGQLETALAIAEEVVKIDPKSEPGLDAIDMTDAIKRKIVKKKAGAKK